MNVEPLAIPEVLLLRPRIFHDPRGYFLELHHRERYEALGIAGPFVQDNASWSRRGVLRGLHFQHPSPQGKLVMPLVGDIYDVAVDLRRSSPTFGTWVAATLRAETHDQLWVPPGFAHGFCVVSETAFVAYKCTDVYDPKSEATLLFSDEDLGIPWPVAQPIVSDKDRAGLRLRDFAVDRLPG